VGVTLIQLTHPVNAKVRAIEREFSNRGVELSHRQFQLLGP